MQQFILFLGQKLCVKFEWKYIVEGYQGLESGNYHPADFDHFETDPLEIMI